MAWVAARFYYQQPWQPHSVAIQQGERWGCSQCDWSGISYPKGQQLCIVWKIKEGNQALHEYRLELINSEGYGRRSQSSEDIYYKPPSNLVVSLINDVRFTALPVHHETSSNFFGWVKSFVSGSRLCNNMTFREPIWVPFDNTAVWRSSGNASPIPTWCDQFSGSLFFFPTPPLPPPCPPDPSITNWNTVFFFAGQSLPVGKRAPGSA